MSRDFPQTAAVVNRPDWQCSHCEKVHRAFQRRDRPRPLNHPIVTNDSILELILISIPGLLNCKTCNSLQEQNDFLCSSCICPHVRRGHENVDQRGYEMSICASHKLMNDLFCIQCSQVVCNKCILNHRGQGYISLKPNTQRSTKSATISVKLSYKYNVLQLLKIFCSTGFR